MDRWMESSALVCSQPQHRGRWEGANIRVTFQRLRIGIIGCEGEMEVGGWRLLDGWRDPS